MARILLVAYYYPPNHASGGQRPLKMAEYLPQFGHDVVVLTSSYARKTSAEKNIIRVYDPSHNKNRVGLRKFQWFFLRLAVELLNRLGIYTSIYSPWKRSVLRKANEIVAQVKPEWILATYPPVETLEIACRLSKNFHLPFIADFRDGLLFEAVEKKRLARFACIRRTYEKIERQIAGAAQAIIADTPALTRYFSQTYHCPKQLTLPNGFDERDFGNLPQIPFMEKSKFKIVHTGSFGLSESGRDVNCLNRTLEQIQVKDPEILPEIQIHLVGELKRNESKLLKKWLEMGSVAVYGSLERPLALAFQQNADLLLLVSAVDQISVAAGKLFEYLGARKPILGLTWGTYAAEIIEETGSGWTIHPENSAEIADLLIAMIRQPRLLSTLRRNEQAISRFSRPRQMRELAAFIHSLKKKETSS